LLDKGRFGRGFGLNTLLRIGVSEGGFANMLGLLVILKPEIGFFIKLFGG
jgi:hypothetical protein